MDGRGTPSLVLSADHWCCLFLGILVTTLRATPSALVEMAMLLMPRRFLSIASNDTAKSTETRHLFRELLRLSKRLPEAKRHSSLQEVSRESTCLTSDPTHTANCAQVREQFRTHRLVDDPSELARLTEVRETLLAKAPKCSCLLFRVHVRVHRPLRAARAFCA